jgi:hypothetical protein
MVEYSCSLCSFKTNLKSNHTRHLQTNKHKKAEIEAVKNLHQFTSNTINLHQFTSSQNQDINQNTNNSLIESNNNKVKCNYCNLEIIKNNLTRHQRTKCDKIPIYKRKILVDKYNNHKSSKKQLVIHNNNINNNSHNTTNIQNNNIQNNITVKINPLGQEDISFLTEKDKLEILAKRFMGVPELIKRIYGNPKNKNFFIPNVNKKVIAYLNEDNKLEYDNYYTILNQIIDENKDRFDDFYHELIDKINNKLIDKVAVVIQEHSNNEKINDKYIDDIKFNLISNSKEIKEIIEKYMKEIKEKISLGLEDY